MSIAADLHRGPWTIADVEAIPETGDRYEILAPGVLTVSPAPGLAHQRASRRLANLLEAAAMAAGVDVDVLEAINVELPGDRLAIPDVAVVDGSVADACATRVPAAAVLLAVEIVSPASKATARAIKPDLYAEAGIPVFLRVDLEPSPQMSVYLLDGTTYRLATTLVAGIVGSFDEPFPVRLDPADLIARRIPGS